MPIGQKPDLKSGVVVDFDQIYNDAIKPGDRRLIGPRQFSG
jgi:hypothetical protein